MYLSKEIDVALEERKHKYVGVNGYYKIIYNLNRSLGSKDLKFKHEVFNDLEKDTYSISGLYDMMKDTRYVILNFSDKSLDLDLPEYHWKDFKFYLSQVIQHESIHQKQWQYRDDVEDQVKLDFRNLSGTKEEERDYLSDLDEIDAYGHDIAMEIKHFYPRRDPYEVLKNINKTRKLSSFNYYRRNFRGCDWSMIKNKLLLKTYKWIPYA